MTRTLIKRRVTSTLPGRFDDLVALLPPRAIHDNAQYEAMTAVIDSLLRLRRLTREQQEYLETLSILVATYDQEHFANDLSTLNPVDCLKYLMDHNGLTASQLGELLGNRALGSKILRGERQLSKTHIRILADRFKVDPGLFL